MKALNMGRMSKTIAVYKTPFWKNKGLSALMLTPEEVVNSCYDISPFDHSVGMI